MPEKLSWLESARLEHDFSYLDVARVLGMSKQGYWAIETGRRKPSVKTAKRIARLLAFDWTKFF